MRNLASVSQGGNRTSTFAYNADGLRVAKNVTYPSYTKNTEYRIVNGQYIGEITTIGDTEYVIAYVYDENGAPAGLNINGGACYFVKNLQGDVIAIVDYQGNLIAKYTYSAYGEVVSVRDASGNIINSATHIAMLNPFRYRGYMYDNESGFYYLRTRYYDPVVARFLNADGLVSTGTGLGGYNMFAYCNGNPVMFVDPYGMAVEFFEFYEQEILNDILNNGGTYNARDLHNLKKSAAYGDPIDITKLLNKEMRANRSDFIEERRSKDYSEILKMFLDYSKTGGKWDLKTQWSLPDIDYVYNGNILRFDDLGNIHFGYVGSCLFTVTALRIGAGLYQLYTYVKGGQTSLGPLVTFFDDPRDSLMIKIGYYTALLDQWR